MLKSRSILGQCFTETCSIRVKGSQGRNGSHLLLLCPPWRWSLGRWGVPWRLVTSWLWVKLGGHPELWREQAQVLGPLAVSRAFPQVGAFIGPYHLLGVPPCCHTHRCLQSLGDSSGLLTHPVNPHWTLTLSALILSSMLPEGKAADRIHLCNF